ncbi:holin family protein [Desulfobacula phenolica]|uniref:Holin of 3TMs, for gene-transfer release n=1 Tax=Desulfobacula phenolica TaxID=90732 RepID=A0A1H2H5K7_9BACT|nr:holin family protein [Desulfobacula phenolica]SDU27019.1 Holin of 3TMs, for gene-transfer release [Desulfobacula phenolica]
MDLTGIGSVADFAGDLVKRFFPMKMTDAEKAQAQMNLQGMLQEREASLVESQKSIIVSEMQQADRFTKRARPSIVYAGLLFILLVHVLFPIAAFFTARPMPTLTLPTEFWWAWSGVCGVWVIGRTAEKRGVAGKLVNMISGGK